MATSRAGNPRSRGYPTTESSFPFFIFHFHLPSSFLAFPSLRRRRSLLPRPRHDALDSYWLAPLPLALIGGFHEGEDLERLLGLDGRLAGPEELDDLHEQRLIA